MAYFLFIDESGHDRRASPYEVLAGISVEDQHLWNLIEALNDLEEECFGLRYSREKDEIKAKKFLKRKVFRHAGQMDSINDPERRELARECLLHGGAATRRQITALAQAKLGFVSRALELCLRYKCNVFASVVEPIAPQPEAEALRKDYSYLFERFYYFLEDRGQDDYGVVVFDELEKTRSHLLVEQMEIYFRTTATGRARARHIIPEPFFVHSDLTSLIQIADLVAYTISWGFRIPGSMSAPARRELKDLVELVAQLRYLTKREIDGNPDFKIWSFAYIEDLRGREEKGGGN